MVGRRYFGLTFTLRAPRIENGLRRWMHDLARTFEDLVGRPDGPLHFRLIFQPLMAALFAIRDRRRDARAGRRPFRLMTDPAQRRHALLTGWKSAKFSHAWVEPPRQALNRDSESRNKAGLRMSLYSCKKQIPLTKQKGV